MRKIFLWTILVLALAAPAAGAADLDAAIAGPRRSPGNVARDVYRHPAAVLSFMGLRDDMTVVEVSPGPMMWWTEILAPLLKDRGHLYLALAGFEKDAVTSRMAADPATFGRMTLTSVGDPAPEGSADLLLTFRNLHNWLGKGTAESVLAGFYRALKPGGVLGLTDHRADPAQPADPKAQTGYVNEEMAVALVQKAGFKLVARSAVNDNPKDSKDYPGGVWTLPPTFILKDVDRAKYAAIGEADEFTLKFVKP